MIYNKVLSVDSVELATVREIYESSFPVDERRAYDLLLALLAHEESFTLEAICNEDRVEGMLASWQLDEWRYVEHFAIEASRRGAGIGREVLCDFLERDNSPVVLEVEPPTDYDSCHRIAFYRSMGFVLHDTYRYIQPSYGAGREAVELCLMTYAAPAECNLDRLSLLLHRRVYGVR
ncbi:MAG: GNAT family N-acetyltransferase [Bacteroidales bacterium]|nr:GNAT family N-acetyltransferase [Bacteroidales bacterium]